MRPFKVGDMVVSNSGDIGVIKLIKLEWTKQSGWRVFEKPLMVAVKAGTRHFSEDEIKTIRSQRKGSAEARSMVFISACYYRAKLNKRFRHLVMLGYTNGDAYLSAKECAQNSVEGDIYTEQLSRLRLDDGEIDLFLNAFAE